MKICKIKGCTKTAKNRGMCWMHYTRQRRHGDAAVRLTHENKGAKCIVPGCEREAVQLGFCMMHRVRLRRHGTLELQRAPNGAGCIDAQGYRVFHNGKQLIREHRLVTEKALGHSLPAGAQVHHLNGIKTDNRNCNLVVCPSLSYHMLLHKRQRELGYKGPPLPSSETVAGTAALPVCSSDEGERN